MSCSASGSAPRPTSAPRPADSTTTSTPRFLSACARRTCAIGLRQMLPVHTMRTRSNTTLRRPRGERRMLASLSTGSQIPICLRGSPTRCKHGLGIDPAQRPFHEDADPLQGNLVVAIDPAPPVVPVHLDVGERGSSDGVAGGDDGLL